MNVNVLEKPVENKSSYKLDFQLKELTTNGPVNFNSNKKEGSVSNNTLTIPVYGVYRISWGFKQNSIHTFYKDVITSLELVISNEVHEENAVITKNTSSFHAIKSANNTLTILLRENENIFLNAKTINANKTNMKNIYLKVEKLNVDEDTNFSY